MSIQGYSQIDSPDPVAAQDLATKNYVDLGDKSYSIRAVRTAAFTFPATAGAITNPFLWDTVTGTTSAYSAATGAYTCPVAGTYFAKASCSAAVVAGASLNITFYINGGGAWVAGQAFNGSAASSATLCTATMLVACNAGDTITTGVQCSIASASMRITGAEEHFVVGKIGA